MLKYTDNFWICSSVQTVSSTAVSRFSKYLLSLIRVPSESKSRYWSSDSSTCSFLIDKSKKSGERSIFANSKTAAVLESLEGLFSGLTW